MLCPICKSELSYIERDLIEKFVVKCKNNCYYKRRTSTSTHYKIFDKNFILLNSETILRKIKIKLLIKKEIKYWRKNNRYLTQFLNK